MNEKTYTIYGGMRGGGKTFADLTAMLLMKDETIRKTREGAEQWKSAALCYLSSARQRWIPVADGLPDTQEYDWVLVNIRLMPEDYDGVPCVAELRNGSWYDATNDLLDTSEEGCGVIVTHWMPLPEPPKENK